jgi:hypothetical protein
VRGPLGNWRSYRDEEILRAGWSLSASFPRRRVPCTSLEALSSLALPRCPQAPPDDEELLRLGRNELSVAKICAANLLDLAALTDTVEDPGSLLRGLAVQAVEEVDHAVLSFIALNCDPRPYGFSAYKAMQGHSPCTRLLFVVVLEIEELSIRPRRLSAFTDRKTREADAVALIDDVGHIRNGARALAQLKAVLPPPDLAPIVDYLRERTSTIHQDCTELLLCRLVEDDEIKRWIRDAALLTGSSGRAAPAAEPER